MATAAAGVTAAKLALHQRTRLEMSRPRSAGAERAYEQKVDKFQTGLKVRLLHSLLLLEQFLWAWHHANKQMQGCLLTHSKIQPILNGHAWGFILYINPLFS